MFLLKVSRFVMDRLVRVLTWQATRKAERANRILKAGNDVVVRAKALQEVCIEKASEAITESLQLKKEAEKLGG